MISNVIKQHGVSIVRDGLSLMPIELRAEGTKGTRTKYFTVDVDSNGELFLEFNGDVYLCDSLEDLDDWLSTRFDSCLSWEAFEKLKGILESEYNYTNWW